MTPRGCLLSPHTPRCHSHRRVPGVGTGCAPRPPAHAHPSLSSPSRLPHSAHAHERTRGTEMTSNVLPARNKKGACRPASSLAPLHLSQTETRSQKQVFGNLPRLWWPQRTHVDPSVLSLKPSLPRGAAVTHLAFIKQLVFPRNIAQQKSEWIPLLTALFGWYWWGKGSTHHPSLRPARRAVPSGARSAVIYTHGNSPKPLRTTGAAACR